MPSMCALLAVWVNGVEVGYSQDSKLPCEFDITAHLRYDGQPDVIALLVLCWCDGAYLEDQDMWWLSGITRSVSLSLRPHVHVRDFSVRTSLVPWDGAATAASMQADGGGGYASGGDAAVEVDIELRELLPEVARAAGVCESVHRSA